MKKINFKHIKKVDDRYVLRLAREYRAVFGFGERFDCVNQKGKLVLARIETEPNGAGSRYAVPFFLTPDGFGLFVDTYATVEFDFRRDGELTVSFPVTGKEEPASVWYFEGTPKEILEKFRTLVGRSRIFPKWVLGAWMSAGRWDTQEEVNNQRMLARKWNFPHNALVIDHWNDAQLKHLFVASSAPFREAGDEFAYADMHFSPPWPDPRALVDGLHADGIRVILGIAPAFSLHDGTYEHLVLTGEGGSYVTAEGEVFDYTNRPAVEKLLKKFSYLRELGIDGIRTDGGEVIFDDDAVFSDGTTGLEGNRYPELVNEAFAGFVGMEGVVLARAGGLRTPTHAVLRAGEQSSTWAEFASAIRAGLSAGLTGTCCWGFDIAGVQGYLPSAELYLRAAQAAAFVPLMQWHSGPGDEPCDSTGAWKINDRSPWNLSAFHKAPELLDIVRDQFFLHYNLMPYLYNLMRESSKTGVPAMRHLFLEFPDDEATYGMDDEFMLGDALLVAPVLRDYTATRKVYLPRGRWYDFYTGAVYGGGWHEIELEKSHSPVFMRENTCVVLNLKDGRICSDVGNRLDRYRELTFLVAGEGKFEFADDLGNSISLAWNQRECYARRNRTAIAFRSMRMGRDKIV